MSRLGTPIFTRQAIDGEHWIVADSQGRFPLMLMGDIESDTPVVAVSPLDANFVSRAEAIVRLWRLLNGQRYRRSVDRLTPRQREQLVLALRALDGRLAGATYREIAEVLFGTPRVPAGSSWKTHDLRGRTIRLVRMGLNLMRGGYLDLLRFARRPRR